MSVDITRRAGLATMLALAAAPMAARGAYLKGGTLRVALLSDMQSFDPMNFTTLNFPLIKNLYDSLIEYDAAGAAIPSLATAWKIAPDNTAVTVTLRHSKSYANDCRTATGAPRGATCCSGSATCKTRVKHNTSSRRCGTGTTCQSNQSGAQE